MENQLGNEKEFLEMKYTTDKIKKLGKRLKRIRLKTMLVNCKVKSEKSSLAAKRLKWEIGENSERHGH